MCQAKNMTRFAIKSRIDTELLINNSPVSLFVRNLIRRRKHNTMYTQA